MNICKSLMLYFNRIDASEGIDINKTRESKECNIFHYCFFLQIKALSFNQMSAMGVMSWFINDVYEP